MRNLVAISALREFGHDACRMLVSMAILAFRDHFVFFLMTVRALQRAVLCLRRGEEAVCISVARGAVFGFRISRIRHNPGHMRLMALLTISRGHIGGVGFVTLRAVRHFTVNAMAGGAVLSRMFTLIFTQLLYLRRMTGKTGVRQRRRQGDRQGSVRIRMAAQTCLELKVGLALMALVARGDIIL